LEFLQKEFKYRTSRSSGSGGQHVNKVATQVELLFDVLNSKVLSENQKKLLQKKLKKRISSNGVLILSCDETRSQSRNKAIVLKRLDEMLRKALAPTKKRITTKPSKASQRKRLRDKKKLSEKKANRKIKDE
jgi:ribosome-associated protein